MAANNFLALGNYALVNKQPWQRPVTVYENGQAVYSTWIRTYYHAHPNAPQIYMTNGLVFSAKTRKQLPYKLHKGKKFEFADTAETR